MAPSPIITTSYLLGNLHCPSCVSRINSLLFDTYGDQIEWVSPNLVTSVVTVEHRDSGLDIVRGMEKTLEEAGFEVCGVKTESDVPQDPTTPRVADSAASTSPWLRLWQTDKPSASLLDARAAHLDNCEACRLEASGDQSDEENAKLASSHRSVPPSNGEASSHTSFTGVVADDGSAPSSTWRIQLSVGGMTCASCANGITQEVQKLPYVSKVVVNLVANSATVECTEPNREKDVADAIEDIGYDASVNNVTNLQGQIKTDGDREIEIKIDGIFCHRCPSRVCETLRAFDSSIDITHEPTVKKPILKLRYTPNVPSFTIRHILRAIEAADPSLHASIYHPPTLEERSRAIRAKHQRELLWREIMTAILAVPTFVLGIVYMSLVPDSDHSKQYLMRPWKSGLSRMDIILCILATPVYFFAADVFHSRAIKEIRSLWRRNSRVPFLARFYKFGSMNMLMSLGTSIAYLSSIAQMIVVVKTSRAKSGHSIVPDNMFYEPQMVVMNKHDSILTSNGQFYFDSVVFLTLFLLAGRLIEAYAKSKTGDAVEALAKLRPTSALLIQDGPKGQTTTSVGIDELELGDTIKVLHGASPPTDGLVLVGESSFDESSLTGESRLIKKTTNDQVFAGTINQGSTITIKVTGASGKSMLDQIVEVVREGQTKRAPVERIADVVTTYFVPVVTLIALLTWAIWLTLTLTNRVPDAHFDTPAQAVAFALQFSIAVFVIACPCGLALAAPTAIFVGGGLAAKYGILAKGGGEAFEKASRIDCVVFDKTGTLTEGGAPSVTDSLLFPNGPIEEVSEEKLLSALKGIEENSSHPIAKAIVDFCGRTVARSANVGQVEELPGRGMKATCDTQSGLEMAVGNELLLRDLGVSVPESVAVVLQTWKTEAKSIALVVVKGRDGAWVLAAALSISDPIRPEAISVVKALQARGTQVWMLSGDNITTAQAVAQRIGIPKDQVLAEVLPSEKADKVKYLQASLHAGAGMGIEDTSRRATVAMVGDGINDSPALTMADVGIAIGSGSDVAVSSADFVLATSKLEAVLVLLELSRAVLRRIKVNFAWAAVYNVLALPVAAGCLYALKGFGGSHITLDPVWASLAMALSSISVVLSSLSLRSKVPLLGFRPSRLKK
ncbi:hypothetical protein B0I35DRAFT_429742 [Stachybotrys elegans]|uniref:HMA domain-containing protein n=1 Tax=Stachybotrys elegans TaxID=80388 RepID=A0A8K0WR98_9HYPO|nr:hypothetical protein B0I35DRAFT_429742 [Stachybotrys elegans]